MCCCRATGRMVNWAEDTNKAVIRRFVTCRPRILAQSLSMSDGTFTFYPGIPFFLFLRIFFLFPMQTTLLCYRILLSPRTHIRIRWKSGNNPSLYVNIIFSHIELFAQPVIIFFPSTSGRLNLLASPIHISPSLHCGCFPVVLDT